MATERVTKDLAEASGIYGGWRSSELVIVSSRAFARSTTRIGAAITLLVLILAIVGPFVGPYDPDSFVGIPFTPPSADFWLGTDSIGRDVFTRVLAGGGHLLIMSIAATLLGVGAGAIIGMSTSVMPDRLREAVMWVLDVILAFPQVVLALLFLSMLGTSVALTTALVALAHMPRVARMADTLARAVIKEDFIQVSVAQGVPLWARITREIAPNVGPVILIEAGLRLTWSIAMIAALSFLGLGVQPPASDWGLMINENRSGLAFQPWATLAPTILIALYAIGTNLMAEGFSAALARERGPQ